MSLASMIQQAQQQQAAQLQQQALNMPTLRQFGDVTITPQNAAQYNTTLAPDSETGTLPGYQQALDDLIKQMGGSDQMGSQWTNLSKLFQQPGFADKFLSMYPAAKNYLPSYLQSGMVQATGADNGYGSLADIAPMLLAIGGGALGAAAGAGAEGASVAGAGGAEGASPMLLADAGTTMTDVGAGYGAGGSLGGGITPGVAAGGVGGGALGTGLNAGTTTGAVGGGALGGGLTGAGTTLGTFGGESLYPVLGGTASAAGATGLGSSAGAAGSGGGTAAAAAGGTALSRILDGTGTTADYLSVLGTAGLTGASIYGTSQAANKFDALARDYMGLGAPSRDRYEASFDPNFDINKLPGLQGALDTSYQGLLRGLSTQGNPFGNPGGLTEAMKYITGNVALPALQQYRNQNAATGGYGAFSTAAPGMASNAINTGANIYSDLGRGAAQILNPPTSLEQALKGLKSLV